MKKAMSQLAWAIIFGLGIPGLMLSVAAEANRRVGQESVPHTQPPAWTAPLESTDSEVDFS